MFTVLWNYSICAFSIRIRIFEKKIIFDYIIIIIWINVHIIIIIYQGNQFWILKCLCCLCVIILIKRSLISLKLFCKFSVRDDNCYYRLLSETMMKHKHKQTSIIVIWPINIDRFIQNFLILPTKYIDHHISLKVYHHSFSSQIKSQNFDNRLDNRCLQ